MKYIATAALALMLSTGSVMADPVFGKWASPKNDAGSWLHLTIAQCGSAICGTITELFGSGDASIHGKQMVWDMQPKGGGEYRGKIWAPDTDKTYNGKMNLSGASLKLSGCVLGICRGETFARVN